MKNSSADFGTLEFEMPAQSRFVTSILAAADQEEVRLPWTRGAERKAMIARRKAREAEGQVTPSSDLAYARSA